MYTYIYIFARICSCKYTVPRSKGGALDCIICTHSLSRAQKEMSRTVYGCVSSWVGTPPMKIAFSWGEDPAQNIRKSFKSYEKTWLLGPRRVPPVFSMSERSFWFWENLGGCSPSHFHKFPIVMGGRPPLKISLGHQLYWGGQPHEIPPPGASIVLFNYIYVHYTYMRICVHLHCTCM